MTSVDVGDTIMLTFPATAGAEVTITWMDPALTPVYTGATVAEDPTGSGLYPTTVVCSRPGTWTAQFTAVTGTTTATEQYYVRASALTGPPPLAVLDDVSVQFGTMTPSQQTTAAWLLRAASRMVRARFPAIDIHIADGILDPEVVALGVSNMVIRVLRNPKGLRAETIGPFARTFDVALSRTATGAQPSSAGILSIGDHEIELFTPTKVANMLAYGVGTIMMQPGLAPPCEGGLTDRFHRYG